MDEAGTTLVHGAARRQGLGEVQRIYRERNPLWTVKTQVIIGIAAAVVAVGALPESRWRWPALLLGPVLGAAAVAVYMFLGAVSGVQHRRLIGVSPSGVLVYTEDHGSIALPWDRIATVVREPGRDVPYRYLIVYQGDEAGRFGFRDIHDGRSLVASIESKQPVRAPVLRRALAGTAIAVVVVLLAGASIQQAFRVAQVFGTPDDLKDFAKVCEEPGSAFRRTAPYAVTAPRPVVIFDGKYGPSWTGSGPWGPNSPAKVQVVMCVRRSGSGQVVRTCQYQELGFGRDTHVLSLLQGLYEVTVYEARTRKHIRTRTLTGSDGECPTTVSGRLDVVYGTLTAEQFHESMADIVGKP